MSRLEDFKDIADEVMCDIRMTDSLKNKTLMKLETEIRIGTGNRIGTRIGTGTGTGTGDRTESGSQIKTKNKTMVACPIRLFPIKKPLIILGSFILILGLVNLADHSSGNLSDIKSIFIPKEEAIDSEVNLLLAPSNGNDDEMANNWTLESVDEAQTSFGEAFLVPAYISEGFSLEKIKGYGQNRESLSKVVFTYTFNDQSFLIIEDKNAFPYSFSDFEKVDINGETGYLKKSSATSNTDGYLDTELYWQINGIDYQIMGFISEEEAIKIAKSMIKND